MSHNTTEIPIRSDLATITARICGVSDNYVRKVIRGDRDNDKIFDTYMELKEGKTLLIKAIEKAVKL